MATNAPYYQLRGQFTNGANAPFPAADANYDLSDHLRTHHGALTGDAQASESHTGTLEENHNLVELLEAATTAAGQAAEAMGGESQGPTTASQGRNKRKRSLTPPPVSAASNSADDGLQRDPRTAYKRARTDVPTDPRLQASGVDVQHASISNLPASGETLLNDARAAGVHSAAALFRRSSKEPARKYTRPPMSKLFMSLQLTPENFLQLQARAKAYMLDPAHPERQSCVGNRGKGDTDMVKLKLFNCVRDFLTDGAGDQFFGEHVEKPAENDTIEAARALGEDKVPAEGKLVWPRDGNRIISLVTPLLRRMVTNERQRMYAIETRKGGRKKDDSVGASQSQDSRAPQTEGMGDRRLEVQDTFQSSHPVVPQNQTPLSSIDVHRYQINNQNMSHTPSPPHSINDRTGIFAMSPVNRTAREPLRPNENVVSSPTRFRPNERPLPTAMDRNSELSKINIFLHNRGLKLAQRETITGSSDYLREYTWEQIQQRIEYQLGLAWDMYPELREEYMRTTGQEQAPRRPRGMEPEALRGLAVAATEMQDTANQANTADLGLRVNAGNVLVDNALLHFSPTDPEPSNPLGSRPAGSSSIASLASTLEENAASVRTLSSTESFVVIPSVPDDPFRDPNPPSPSHTVSKYQQDGRASLPPSTSLSKPVPIEPSTGPQKYIVKAIMTTGLTEIRSPQDWENVKSDIGVAIWANGKISVTVELVS